MKIRQIALGFTAFFIFATCHAAQNDLNTLHSAREKIAKQYLLDLQKADYKDIAELFEKNGIVVSTSKGKANAKEFFYSFLPNVVSAHTELHQIFTNKTDINRLAARFHLSFKLKDSEEKQGEYMDEFVFTDGSEKLSAVYMFENLKFEEGDNLSDESATKKPKYQQPL